MEVAVTETALANEMEKQMATTPSGAPDIQALLADLEEQLSNCIGVLGPSVKEIRGSLVRSAEDIRTDKDATLLWNGLNDLQKFLGLVQQICSAAGAHGPKVADFDNELGDALAGLEKVVVEAPEAEDVAQYIENVLVKSFDKWPAAEAEIRERADVDGKSSS
jgi:hypothetical protein